MRVVLVPVPVVLSRSVCLLNSRYATVSVTMYSFFGILKSGMNGDIVPLITVIVWVSILITATIARTAFTGLHFMKVE